MPAPCTRHDGLVREQGSAPGGDTGFQLQLRKLAGDVRWDKRAFTSLLPEAQGLVQSRLDLGHPTVGLLDVDALTFGRRWRSMYRDRSLNAWASAQDESLEFSAPLCSGCFISLVVKSCVSDVRGHLKETAKF